MKIAVVEKGSSAFNGVREAISNEQQKRDWKVDYFKSGRELLALETSSQYDAILLDHSLEDGSEKLILNVLVQDDIDIAILNGPPSMWSDIDLVEDNQVNALIDKSDPENVLKWLRYVGVKHRLTSRVKIESGIYSEIISKTNGCDFEII